MIRYNKRIFIKQTRAGEWQLETDRGERYLTNHITNNSAPVTYWWEQQHQSDQRKWQKDVVIGEIWRQHGELELFTVYKQGAGFSQPHDIVIAYSKSKKLWLLSTNQHTWIMPSEFTDCEFHIDMAMGPVHETDPRQEIYAVIDGV
jgi:hypothetical protein